MKDHPILFKAEMIRAILYGQKTQTRRTNLKTKYAVGDRLWVKETWCLGRIDQGDEPDGHPGQLFISQCAGDDHLLFRADHADIDDDEVVWKPSLFMSRKQSRITLEVTAVREERLQDISEEDAKAEGIQRFERRPGGMIVAAKVSEFGIDARTSCSPSAKSAYELLWESINGPGSWDENPVVRVISFKRVEA